MTAANILLLDFHMIKFKMARKDAQCSQILFFTSEVGVENNYLPSQPRAIVNKVLNTFILIHFPKAPSSGFHCRHISIILGALGLEKLPVKTGAIIYLC